jgi:hypothetical protein
MRYGGRGDKDETLFWKSEVIPPQRNELRKLSFLASGGGRNERLWTFSPFPFCRDTAHLGPRFPLLRYLDHTQLDTHTVTPTSSRDVEIPPIWGPDFLC